MIYAEFQHDSAVRPGFPVPMLGSDGVFICDGRKTAANQIGDAKARARRLNAELGKGITGLIMYRGESFTDSRPVGGFIAL